MGGVQAPARCDSPLDRADGPAARHGDRLNRNACDELEDDHGFQGRLRPPAPGLPSRPAGQRQDRRWPSNRRWWANCEDPTANVPTVAAEPAGVADDLEECLPQEVLRIGRALTAEVAEDVRGQLPIHLGEVCRSGHIME
jgi:hypothetical protein